MNITQIPNKKGSETKTHHNWKYVQTNRYKQDDDGGDDSGSGARRDQSSGAENRERIVKGNNEAKEINYVGI